MHARTLDFINKYIVHTVRKKCVGCQKWSTKDKRRRDEQSGGDDDAAQLLGHDAKLYANARLFIVNGLIVKYTRA